MAVDIALYVKSIMALQLGMMRLFLPPSKSCRNADQISPHNLGKPEAFYSVSVMTPAEPTAFHCCLKTQIRWLWNILLSVL